MKIEEKPPIVNISLFEDVPRGTVFKDEEGTIYMKLDSGYKSPDLVGLYNAVDLKYGILICFNDPNEEVEILKNAILTITRGE